MPFVKHIHYEEAGKGRHMLFVHGWCMSSAIWGLQRDEVAKHHRFIALDLRGHGKSGLSQEGVGGFSGYAEDIINLVEQLDLHNLIVVGWSLGSQALLKAWPEIKERVSGMVLVGATPRFSAAQHFPFALAPKEAEGMQIKVRRNFNRAIEGFHRNLFVEGEFDDPAAYAKAAELLSEVLPPSSLAALEGLETLMTEEVMEEASQVSCPTLLLHGEEDRVCLPEASVWLKNAIYKSYRITFPRTGHAPFLSHPIQFNQALLDFAGGLGENN